MAGGRFHLAVRQRVEVQVADSRSVEMKRQPHPMHLTLESEWDDVRVTLSFLIIPGEDDLIILGTHTLREDLNIHLMRPFKETVWRRNHAQTYGSDPFSGPVDVRGSDFPRQRVVQVNVEAQQGAARDVVVDGNDDTAVTVYLLTSSFN